MGEHLPCKQGVMGSNPIISSQEALTGNFGDMQLKMQAVSRGYSKQKLRVRTSLFS